jgi:hypothetical protein
MAAVTVEPPALYEHVDRSQMLGSSPSCLLDVTGATMVYFIHRLLDFREAELLAVADMLGIPPASLNIRRISNDLYFSPLRIVHAVSEEMAVAMANRAVLVKVSL